MKMIVYLQYSEESAQFERVFNLTLKNVFDRVRSASARISTVRIDIDERTVYVREGTTQIWDEDWLKEELIANLKR